MNPYLSDQRQATRDLIDSEPTVISLGRFTSSRTPAGGMVKSSDPVAQDAKARFFAPTSSSERFITTADGTRLDVDHVLVGTHDDDLKENDAFTVNGRNFRILWIAPNKEYEIRAFCKEDTRG